MRLSLTDIGEGFRIAARALWANKLRAVLTTLGIVIGIVVVTVIISVIQGLNAFISDEISGLGADTLYITRMPWIISTYEEFVEYQKRRKIKTEHYEMIRDQATLAEAVAPSITTARQMRYKNEVIDRVFITGTSDSYVQTANVMPEKGRFLSAAEIDQRRNVCVIGYEVATNLFKDEEPLGKRVKIGGRPFVVIGVLEKRGQMFGFSMDNFTIIPFTTFQKFYGSRRGLEIQVRAKSPELVEALEDQLVEIMRRVRSIEAGKPNDFSVNKQSQLMDTYNQLTQTLYVVLVGIGSIALLVGGIGIMNIMLVSVTERTREIGIRKAVGAKRRVIMWQFLVESMFISGIGVTIGIAISIGISMIVKSVSPIPVNISTWVLFLGISFTATIGIFFGLYPASKASRLDPIVALRYE